MNEQSLKSLVSMFERGTLLSAEGEAELVQGVKWLLEEVETQRQAVTKLQVMLAERTNERDAALALVDDQQALKAEVLVEREACAALCKPPSWLSLTATEQAVLVNAAASIRARGGA